MSTILKTSAAAAALGVLLGTGSAFAKAHDQGVADGLPTPENTGAFVQSVQGPGIKVVVSGVRGGVASANQGENRVEPVVGNGANAEPD